MTRRWRGWRRLGLVVAFVAYTCALCLCGYAACVVWLSF
jgi:hypothetical protein